MSDPRKLLVSLALIGVATATLASGGTFANFSAQTENPATFANGTMTMTNVAGTVVSGSNCTADTNSGVCAAIFSAATTALKPGGTDKSNTVTITYTGSVPTGDFRLYATGYTSKTASSSAFCTATDPATKINLQIRQGASVIFPTSGIGYGTLAAFSGAYSTPTNGLRLNGGTQGAGSAGVWSTADLSTFTIAVNLDATADNPYQGCQSTATFVWYAAQ